MKLRSRDAFPAETSANGAPDEVHHQVLSALQAGRLGISFSGAGFGAAYQLGAAYMLQELGVLQKHTSVTGAADKWAAKNGWQKQLIIRRLITHFNWPQARHSLQVKPYVTHEHLLMSQQHGQALGHEVTCEHD